MNDLLKNAKPAPSLSEQKAQEAQASTQSIADFVRTSAALGLPFIAASNTDALSGNELQAQALAVKAQLKRLMPPTIKDLTGSNETLKPSDMDSNVSTDANRCGVGADTYYLDRLAEHMLQNAIGGDTIRTATASAYVDFLEYVRDMMLAVLERAPALEAEAVRQQELNVQFIELNEKAAEQLAVESIVTPADIVVQQARIEDNAFRLEVKDYMASKAKTASKTKGTK